VNARWLESHEGRSTDELIELVGEYRVDSIVQAFAEALGQKVAVTGEAGLSTAERFVVAANELENEVNCDGYDGFFRNDTEHVPIVLDALSAIGAADAAELTRRAIAILGIDGPVTSVAVAAAMDRDDDDRDDNLNGIDQEWYERVRGLAEPILDYIRVHRADITLPAPARGR
jgi:hypothetical protein